MVPDVEPVPEYTLPDIDILSLELQHRIHKSGHLIFADGRFVRCSLCRARTTKGLRHLTRHRCPMAAKNPIETAPPQPAGPGLPSRLLRDSTTLPMVTPGQRRKRAMVQMAELRRQRALDGRVVGAVAKVAAIGTNMAAAYHFPPADALPPLDLDPTHTYIVCGGFAGCLKCCGVAGYRAEATKLCKPCVQGCPTGSRGPLKRLARGLLPRAGSCWPTGESQPLVHVYRPPPTLDYDVPEATLHDEVAPPPCKRFRAFRRLEP